MAISVGRFYLYRKQLFCFLHEIKADGFWICYLKDKSMMTHVVYGEEDFELQEPDREQMNKFIKACQFKLSEELSMNGLLGYGSVPACTREAVKILGLLSDYRLERLQD